MLKRNDLAQQFELVVQQEIKNYQESLNFVLQSIKELKEEIIRVRHGSLENYAKFHSEHNNLAIQLQNLKVTVDTLNQSSLRTSCDQRTVNERNAIEMRDISSAIHTKISSENHFQEKIDNVWDTVRDLRRQSEYKDRVLNDSSDDLIRRFRNEIQKAKKEILEAPSEASLVKTQLEEKIASHTVDVSGIMRELKIYKHDNMVTQKKIENIYTLIERLQKAKVMT